MNPAHWDALQWLSFLVGCLIGRLIWGSLLSERFAIWLRENGKHAGWPGKER